jgi:tetratricopeptide (TPR) repeat protein
MIRFAIRGAGVLLVVAATLYTLHRCVWLPLHCARTTALAESELAAASERTDYLKRRAGEHALAMLRECDGAFPVDIRLLFARAYAHENAGDPRSAVAAYQRALTIDRRPEIYLSLGIAQLDALDRRGAIESLVRAVAFDPARLGDIRYEDVRNETKQRLRIK